MIWQELKVKVAALQRTLRTKKKKNTDKITSGLSC